MAKIVIEATTLTNTASHEMLFNMLNTVLFDVKLSGVIRRRDVGGYWNLIPSSKKTDWYSGVSPPLRASVYASDIGHHESPWPL
jgi:hypothetical protein